MVWIFVLPNTWALVPKVLICLWCLRVGPLGCDYIRGTCLTLHDSIMVALKWERLKRMGRDWPDTDSSVCFVSFAMNCVVLPKDYASKNVITKWTDGTLPILDCNFPKPRREGEGREEKKRTSKLRTSLTIAQEKFFKSSSECNFWEKELYAFSIF